MTHRLMLVTCGALVAAFVSNAGATSPQRTFVSSHGNDANPCSLASPCRGFAAAVAAVADRGEVIVLDSAGYGPVTITKSVSLIAPNGIYAGITVVAGDGVTINAPEAYVVLRGLSINGQGGDNGISLKLAFRLRVESCVISNMAVNGIMHSAPGAEMIVLDTIIRDNHGSGIFADTNASILLDHVRSEHNESHGFILNSSNSSPGASAMITDSIFAFNGIHGIFVASTINGKTHAQVERSVMSDNGGDGIRTSAAGSGQTAVGVTRNSIHNNSYYGVGVLATGAGINITTVSDNMIRISPGGILADGIGVYVSVSSNNMETNSPTFVQTNQATIASYRNNVGRYSASGGAVIQTEVGF